MYTEKVWNRFSKCPHHSEQRGRVIRPVEPTTMYYLASNFLTQLLKRVSAGTQQPATSAPYGKI